MKEDISDVYGLRPNCETVGIDHQFEIISVHNINPFNIEFMISNIPRDLLYSENWSEVIYECSRCNEMKRIEMTTEEVEKRPIST
jgi:hypothetical protein